MKDIFNYRDLIVKLYIHFSITGYIVWILFWWIINNWYSVDLFRLVVGYLLAIFIIGFIILCGVVIDLRKLVK